MQPHVIRRLSPIKISMLICGHSAATDEQYSALQNDYCISLRELPIVCRQQGQLIRGPESLAGYHTFWRFSLVGSLNAKKKRFKMMQTMGSNG